MAEFASLFDEVVQKPVTELKIIQPKKNVKKLGCENCELNNKETHKFITKVRGRSLMIITGLPSEEDENNRKLLTGRAGKFLWRHLEKVGITRDDCDVQSALRCTPDFGIYLNSKEMRHPLKCCSVHTDNALEKSKARVYIIFGIEAAQQVLGKEYRKGTTILWSDRLNARVYVMFSPSWIIRSGNRKMMKEFLTNIRLVAQDLKAKRISKFQYIDAQDYKGIVTGKAAREEVDRIKRYAKKVNIRVYCDEESGRSPKGIARSLCIGTCVKPGRVRVFVLHPRYVDRRNRKEIIAALKDLLENQDIEKAFHYGSYDVPAIDERLGIKVAPYKFDTHYSTYLDNPDFKPSFALDVVGLRHFPEFGEYKTIVLPEAIPEGFDYKEHKMAKATPTQLHDYLSSKGLLNFYNLPLEKLIRYNAADCDLGKRLELMTEKKVSLPLLSIYTDVAFVLDAMAKNGPHFDYDQYKILQTILPPRLEKIDKYLRKVSGKKDFNPNSPDQVKWLLYTKLKLKPPPLTPKDRKAGKNPYNTGKNTLEVLARKHKTPRMVMERRRLSKMITTYLDSYGVCADNNKGKLRTKFKLTGTRTGRMSSGGEKGKKDKLTKVVNLQNVHGDPDIQNMLVPDPKWRKLYEAVKKAVQLVIGDVLFKKLELLAKDKGKKEELEELQEKLYKMLSTSAIFKKYIRIILKKYGDIKVVMGFDQGQIEVRVMAQASGDEKLIADCQSGDIHSKVGHRMTGWAVEKIRHDKKTRTLTKNIHFGILFGLGAEGLMAFILIKDPDSTITEEEAIKLWNNYFKEYKGVRVYIDKQRKFVEVHGYVEGLFGFKRPLGAHEFVSEDEEENGGGAFWGNQAINTPIQGSAHHLMLMAMSLLKDKNNIYRKILNVPGMEVHDYLGWWTPLKKLMKSLRVGKKLLEVEPLRIVKKLYPQLKWRVPLKVEGKCGFRFGDTVETEGLELHEMLLRMFFETHKSDEQLVAQYKAVA